MACEAQEGVTISPAEWHAVELVNKVLKTFVEATARVEGNGPTGCIVLAEYKRVITELTGLRKDAKEFPSLVASINEMIKWLGKYQDESLNTECIILATILNPRSRGKFFTVHYPEHEFSSNLAIETAFNNLLEETNQERSPSPDASNHSPDEPDEFDIFGGANTTIDKASRCELDDYLGGKYPIKRDQSPLGWWKEHEHHFPILAQLARDYLSVSATSCACERTFSAAADICTSSRGGMHPKTMERLVGSQAWMKEGIVPDGDFEEAAMALQAYADSLVQKQKKPK